MREGDDPYSIRRLNTDQGEPVSIGEPTLPPQTRVKVVLRKIPVVRAVLKQRRRTKT